MDISFIKISVFLLLIAANILIPFDQRFGTIHIRLTRFRHVSLNDLLAFVLLVFMFILCISDNDNPDYYNYKMTYVLGIEDSPDMGFILIKNFSRAVGLSFEMFRLVVYTFAFLVLWMALCKLDINKNLVLCLYAFFPFAYDAIQIRLFCTTSIMLYSLHFLLEKKTSSVIKYVIGILIASSFHALGIIYLLFLMVMLDDKKKSKQTVLKIVFGVSILLMLTSVFSDSFKNLLTYLFSLSTTEKKFNHYNKGTNWRNIFILIAQEMFFYFSSKLNKDIVEKTETSTRKRFHLMSELIYGCNLAICCTLPLLMISQNFHRLYRNLSIINYGILGIYCGNKISDNRKYPCIILLALGFLSSLSWNYYQDSFSKVFLIFFN